MNQRAAAMIERADSDGDGKLSLDEAAAARSEGRRGMRLDENGLPLGLDADGDGVVSAEEFETAMDEHHERGGHRFGGRHGGRHDH